MLDEHLFDGMADQNFDRLVIGFSGGVDSQVLLHLACARFGPDMVHLLHVNHGLQAASDAWQDHCEAVARQHGVSFSAVRVVVKRSGSVEENARDARYQAFAEFLQQGDILLLAQHADDQVETLLLSLFRGSGGPLPGGMPRTRKVGPAVLYRPLLAVTRRQIEAYAGAHGLLWVEDSSNLNLDFNRNYLRHKVLPDIEVRWPAFRETLLATLDRARDLQALLDAVAEGDLAAAQDSDGLRIDQIRALGGQRRNNLLRYLLTRLGLPLPRDRQLDVELDRLLAAGPDTSPQLHWQGIYLRRFAGKLYLTGGVPQVLQETEATLNPGLSLSLPDGSLLVESGQDAGLGQRAQAYLLRGRLGGEKIRPRLTGPNRRLASVLQETGVPPWLRDSLPLVFDGDNLVAVPALPAFGVPMLVADSHRAPRGLQISVSWKNQPYSD